MKRLRESAMLLALSLIGPGCTEGPTVPGDPGTAAAHGGTLMDLPGGAGRVELLFQPSAPNAKGAKAKGKITAYFTAKDGKSPLGTTPSEVVFTDEAGKAHPLSAGGDRFESAEITLPTNNDLNGKLTGKLGSESFTLQSRPR